MIRTVWLAVFCLALVSALAAAKALRTPAESIVAGSSVNETTLDISQAQDPLSKSDRLGVNDVRQEAPLPVVLQSIEPTSPAVTPPRPPVEAKIISRHWRDPEFAFISAS